MNLTAGVGYLKSQRFYVDLGFMRDGIKKIVYPKVASLEGDVRQLIEDLLINNKEVVADAYKPNGSSKKFDRSLTFTKEESLGSIEPLFQEPEFTRTKSNPVMVEPTSWKDYALTTEQNKNTKLERELAELRTENKDLDNKVREFEKEMIKKDHEIDKLTGSVEQKTGLAGFATTITNSPEAMNIISGLAAKILNVPAAPTTQTPAVQLEDSTTERYIANIKAWLYKQSDERQEKFYALVYNVCKSKDIENLIDQLLNVTENATRSEPEAGSEE